MNNDTYIEYELVSVVNGFIIKAPSREVLYKTSSQQAVQCRYDWHQTGDSVNFTVYAKKVKPELCTVNCNAVKVSEVFNLLHNWLVIDQFIL